MASSYKDFFLLNHGKLLKKPKQKRKVHFIKKDIGNPIHFLGTSLPAFALAFGLITLFMTVSLATYYQQFHWVFISHLGAMMPAYYFYVLGCTFTAGLLVPSAAIFYMHNWHLVQRSTSDEKGRTLLNTLNKVSFFTAFIAALFFSLQSVFPMISHTTAIHGIFATLFFGLILCHCVITSYFYYGVHLFCEHTHTCICTDNSYFWLYWKITASALIVSFNVILIILVASIYILDPNAVDVLYQQVHPTPLIIAAAVCEYILAAIMILYFCSYLHDLRSVMVVVLPLPRATNKKT